jgi:cytochrome c oxidase assembly factor CtaG
MIAWSFDPIVIAGLAVAAALYWRGRPSLSVVRADGMRRARVWNAVSFYAGLAVIFVALESPIDSLSATLFSFHMLQHLLLIMVAAPLLLLGDPGVTMLRGVPLSLRRRGLGYLSRQRWAHRLGSWLSRLLDPRAVFVIFIGDLYLWHWHVLFDLTLRNDGVHLFEHLCFLGTAIMFWSQVIDQRAIHPRLGYLHRALFTVLTAAAGNFLAMYLVFTPKPLYAYARIAHRPFGMTALGDQQIAGALMWVPVLLLFGGAFAVCLFKALAEDEREAAQYGGSLTMGESEVPVRRFPRTGRSTWTT